MKFTIKFGKVVDSVILFAYFVLSFLDENFVRGYKSLFDGGNRVGRIVVGSKNFLVDL